MNFTKDERKKINALLKERDIRRKGDVFNLINEGGTREQVYGLIDTLSREVEATRKPEIVLQNTPLEYSVFGAPIIAQNTFDDMDAVMSLPYVTGGALMPDAHRVKENHIPVGGVVMSDAILPDAVGNDIACSVCWTLTDMEVSDQWFESNMGSLRYVLRNYAYFGQEINPLPVINDYDFYTNGIEVESELGRQVWNGVKNIARTQFGTSGDGNHFVEWGVSCLKAVPGGFVRTSTPRLAVLSHFGSRAVGSGVAHAFIEFANSQYEMPKGHSNAPLYDNTPEGRDYWRLMEFAGMFAAAGHEWLHVWLLKNLSDRVQLSVSRLDAVYSRHNYAWATADGYLHRKGSTPASAGEFGVIPATMGHETKIVMGMGNADALESASHGAGRTHSRGRALQEFGGVNTADYLWNTHGVALEGGGADEDPRAYKNIDEVMKYQNDCVVEIGGFSPKVVRMADPRFFSKKKRK